MTARTDKAEREKLRDQFAMAALTGILANTEWHGTPVLAAYQYADGMLAARDENK